MWTSSIIVHAFLLPMCYNRIDGGEAIRHGKETRHEQYIVFFDAKGNVRLSLR